MERFIYTLEVQATEEVPVSEENVAEDNGRASSRNFEDFEEQDDGANPIEIEKPEEVPVVEEQPACEEAVTEVAAIEVEIPVVEAEVEPVVEAEPTVEAITEDVVVEDVPEEVVVVAEEAVVAEAVSEEPIAEIAIEVTEEPVIEAVPEEAAEVVQEEVAEVVQEVQEEAQPVEAVSAESVDVVEGEEAISELQVQIGNYSRIAAKSTEDLILSYERAAKSIIEFIRAKKYAFGFKGDTDRKVAIWLQALVLLWQSNC